MNYTNLWRTSNIYLDLYGRNHGKKLLAAIEEQVDYIFVTQQVVREVQRNKIRIAAEFLSQGSKALSTQTLDVPNHLSGKTPGQLKDIIRQRDKIKQLIDKVNSDVSTFVSGVMEQISCSEDEVSKALAPIFSNATAHSPEELQRARDRREIGNPPGKSTDSLGDQITWEQILTHFQGKKKVWIISKDSDYGTITTHNGKVKGFLNHCLYDELCKVTPNPEVYFFQDPVAGLTHFVDATGVKAKKRLTQKDAEEIKNEDAEEIRKGEKNLSYLLLTNEEMRQMMADALKSLPSNEEIRQSLKSLPSNEEMRQSLINILKLLPPNEGKK
jgi:hypothetical protein